MIFGKRGTRYITIEIASNVRGAPRTISQAMRVLQHYTFLPLVGRTQTPKKFR